MKNMLHVFSYKHTCSFYPNANLFQMPWKTLSFPITNTKAHAILILIFLECLKKHARKWVTNTQAHAILIQIFLRCLKKHARKWVTNTQAHAILILIFLRCLEKHAWKGVGKKRRIKSCNSQGISWWPRSGKQKLLFHKETSISIVTKKNPSWNCFSLEC